MAEWKWVFLNPRRLDILALLTIPGCVLFSEVFDTANQGSGYRQYQKRRRRRCTDIFIKSMSTVVNTLGGMTARFTLFR